ncbi:MAG: hypothetical protein QXP44_00215 [Candidatus Bathyarchaeia archaeon]
MPKKDALPDYKTKQAMLYAQDARPAELAAWGRRFLAAGWLYDAIDFFKRANWREGLLQVREQAVREGDVFLVRRLSKALGEETEAATWRRVGEEARRLGKLEFALEAFRLAQDRKAMDQIYELIRPAAAADATSSPADNQPTPEST